MLQAGAKKIGLDVKIVGEPFPVVQSRMQDRDARTTWSRCGAAPTSPTRTTGSASCTAAQYRTRNSSYYKNAEVDELIDKALAITDQEQRRALYEEVSRIVVDEAAGIFINNTK